MTDYHRRDYWDDTTGYPERMRDRLGYRKKLKMSNILEKIKDENVLNLSLTLIKQIRENNRNHQIAKMDESKLYKKQLDYIGNVVSTMQIRKELIGYQQILMQMIIWFFGMLRKDTKMDAENKISETDSIRTTLENLWDVTQDNTIYRIFEVHQQEMRISRKNLCERLGIDERQYRPIERTERTQITEHINDKEYERQLNENPELQNLIRNAVKTGNFMPILQYAGQGMEDSLNLGASHLGRTNPNPFSSVRVDSVPAENGNSNEIIGSEMENLRQTNQNLPTETVSDNETTNEKEANTNSEMEENNLAGILIASSSGNNEIPSAKRKERSSEGPTNLMKKQNTLDTPPHSQPVGQKSHSMKAFKQAFSQPQRNSEYYREYAPHIKIKKWEVKKAQMYGTGPPTGVSYREFHETYYQPQEDLYKKTVLGFKCKLCVKETLKENAMISHVRTHYPPKN